MLPLETQDFSAILQEEETKEEKTVRVVLVLLAMPSSGNLTGLCYFPLGRDDLRGHLQHLNFLLHVLMKIYIYIEIEKRLVTH